MPRYYDHDYPVIHNHPRRYGFWNFVLDVFLTLITYGFWLIWIFVREMRNRR